MSNRNAILQSAVAGILALRPRPGREGPGQLGEGEVLRHRQGRAERLRHRHATPAPARRRRDNAPDDWKYVAKGTCGKLGGKTSPGGPDSGKAPKYFAY